MAAEAPTAEELPAADTEESCDVVVVGLGTSGLVAASAAAREGAKVIGLDRSASMGATNAAMVSGVWAVESSPELQYDNHLTTKDMFDFIWTSTHYQTNAPLLRNVLPASGKGIDLMIEGGVPFMFAFEGADENTLMLNRGGHIYATSGAERVEALQGMLDKFGVDSRWDAEVTNLLIEDGAVVGVRYESGSIVTDVRASNVIIATGGAGRLHYQNFPTSNHYGATADGLVLGYRAGAPLLYQDTIQYHPTGVAFPAQIYGALVTEKVRSLGAMLVNVDGEAFMHPLETRDVAAASIIRECTDRHKGVTTPLGSGVWLDTPMIEQIGGEGTIEKRIPAMLRMYLNYDIDMRKSPILVYPTLHYQNGGLEIGGDGFTKAISNLLVAGEAVGGIHGRNRLMGNSLLDIIVFGRNAGKAAAAKAKETELGTLTLKHIEDYAEELKSAGIESEDVSPLLLPHYARHER